MQDFAPFYPELLGALSGRIDTSQSSFETFIPIFCNCEISPLKMIFHVKMLNNYTWSRGTPKAGVRIRNKILSRLFLVQNTPTKST
jgi:hypothetical protein